MSNMPISKFALALITLFLIIFGSYLVIAGKNIEGLAYVDDWEYIVLPGYFILAIGVGCLTLLIYVITKKKF